MAHPKLGPIIKLMESGKNFELTGQQYRKKTGADFPKKKSYAENQSAVAKRAAEYGYRIEVIPQRIRFIAS